MFGFGKDKRSFTKKLISDIQKREKEESEIITIGKVTPEIQQKREIENTLAQNRKMMQEKREERKKEEKKTKDQLFVINEAKIKMGAHIGTFKVLSDTPTIQGKTVGTKVEKSPANFSFLDGFQVLSVVGDWQDIGTAKYQDNEALIKKSTLTVTGKMPPPNAPIEQGKIEFIDSGQINVVENINTAGMPVPDFNLPDFDIEIKLVKDSFVPLGIADFEGNKENDYIQFKYKVKGSAVDSIEWEISDEKVIYKETVLPEIVVSYRKSKREEIKEKEYIEVGEYPLFWDGFDNDDIYDSAKLSNKRLKVKITAIKGTQKRTDEMEIKPKYSKVDWVDVKIDKRNKKIDATLRVNLRDGGAEGVECSTDDIDPDPKMRVEQTECPWDKIPKETLDKYKKEPIKSRTKTYEELRTMALAGIDKYWSRHADNIGEGVQIGEDFYQVFVKARYDKSGMKAPKIIFFTNKKETNFNRSHNWVLSRKLFYKVGYIYDREWEYREESSEKESFMETAAHEIGHKLLEDYGGKEYSYKHKGTSTWGQNPLEGTTYPASGEIDLMKYADEKYLPDNYYERIILSSEDVLSILWLSKIEIK